MAVIFGLYLQMGSFYDIQLGATKTTEKPFNEAKQGYFDLT